MRLLKELGEEINRLILKLQRGAISPSKSPGCFRGNPSSPSPIQKSIAMNWRKGYFSLLLYFPQKEKS